VLLSIPEAETAPAPQKQSVKAEPLAPAPLEDKVYKLVRQAAFAKQLKKGIN
jgi:hypothetical protein